MARDYTELVVWQLVHKLRIETLKLTRTPPLSRDLRLRSEIEETVSSICRNIPERFRRRTNREFARFLEYSFSSAGELKSLFEDVELKDYVPSTHLAREYLRTVKLRPHLPSAPSVRTCCQLTSPPPIVCR